MSENKFNVNETDVFRLLKYGERAQKISDTAIDNIVIPFPGFDEIEFNGNMWNVIKREKYGQSYTLYIHTLRVCVELLLQYEHTEEKKYYNKAKEIVYSWLNFSEKPTDNKMVWYDHTTANRTQALIHFIYISEKINEPLEYDLFKTSLDRHAEVLMNDEIHNLNNHGLMMDRSLMVLGNVLKNDKYKQKGVGRATNTFWFSFSHNGVHLENSPQYHNMVLRMYEEIEIYLNNRGDSLGEPIIEYMKLAKEYSSLMLRPNKKMPSIGDSDRGIKRTKKKYANIYDKEAGITIIQHEIPKPLFLTYICGYSTKVHKHKDDLSITLNYNNKDFLVDPGPFNYSEHKIRKYMTSRHAHSGFYLNDFDYSIKSSNRYTRKITLENYYENTEYYIVKGSHQDYDGSSAKLTRTIIVFKATNLIVLIDDVKTAVKHDLKFTQKFNLDEHVQIDSYKEKTKLIVDEEVLTLKQFNNIDNYRIITGDKNVPISLNTVSFGKSIETKQLQYEYATNKKSVFITAIYDENLVNSLDIIRNDDKLNIDFNDENYTIIL